MRALVLGLLLAGCAAETVDVREPRPPATCQTRIFDAAPFVVCKAPRGADIRLVHRGQDGAPLGDFDSVRAALGLEPTLIMNAGMYHEDRSAVGLYVEGGEEAAALQPNAGPGNFGMLPNGVFWSDGKRVHVTETLAFARLAEGEDAPKIEFATQSGPMLVIDGALHPRFNFESESRKRRNGVGVSDRHVYFAISDAPVNFHHFARLFRDDLGADNALFFDGVVSRISAPEIAREERGNPLGPMVVLVDGETPPSN